MRARGWFLCVVMLLVAVPAGHQLTRFGCFILGRVARAGRPVPDRFSPPTVPALPGTPLHGTPAGPGLHSPAGHRIPAPPAAACACPGQLPPPLPPPPPGRLPRALQPSPLPEAPGYPAAQANPAFTRGSASSHTRKGLGLRSRNKRTSYVCPPSLSAHGLEMRPGIFCLAQSFS